MIFRIGAGSFPTGATANAQRLRAEVGREASDERAVEVREAKDAAAAYARATLEQVDASATLVAVGGQLRIPEDSEFRHWDAKYLARQASMRIAAGRFDADVVTRWRAEDRMGARRRTLDCADGAYLPAPAPSSDR